MPQDTPSRKLDQYIVRFPDGMRDRLKADAEKNGRSLNAEIVARLDWSDEERGRLMTQVEVCASRLAAAEADLVEQGKEADELRARYDALFNTLNMQSETIQTQSAALKVQAALIGKMASESFYEYGRITLDDVPDDERGTHEAALNEAMRKAAEIFGFEWQPGGWGDD